MFIFTIISCVIMYFLVILYHCFVFVVHIMWVILVFVGHTCSCICGSYLPLCFALHFYFVHTGLCICGGSYLCLLERFVPSRFSSGAQLLRIHVVERDNVSANVVSERILFVGILKWNRYLQMCVFSMWLWTSLRRFFMLSFWEICVVACIL